MNLVRHRRFISVLFSGVLLSIFLTFFSIFVPSRAQDDPDNPDTPEIMRQSRGVNSVFLHSASSLHIEDPKSDEEGGFLNNATLKIRQRPKRQWGCPNGCFSPCASNAHCQQQRYQLATVCVLGCCCPAASLATNLSTACDGDAAVAACLNGLCGQGYFCNSRNFCCRCQSGTSPGECINNMCPAGYACNTNNFCCSIGSGSVLGQCINGQCPIGYACGAGNLCYPVSGNSGPPQG